MNLNSLKAIFPKNSNKLKIPESLLIKKLRATATDNNLIIYENITIYHHAREFVIPIIVIDDRRGIYIFEHKDWSYSVLKNATIERASKQETSEKTLAFEKSHDSIRQRFKEIVHNDGVAIFNFLLMENLDSSEYAHLDDSFQELLPLESIMFNNLSSVDILKKMQNIASASNKLPTNEEIVSTIFSQYTILKDGVVKVASDEQKEFIDSDLMEYQTVGGDFHSGRSSAIISKIIIEKLKDPDIAICVIQESELACDIFKKKLLDTIEYCIVEVDIAPIKILTPLELINLHLSKLKEPLRTSLIIDKTILSKKFTSFDTIICDNSNNMELTFIKYIEHIQKKASLILIQPLSDLPQTHKFTKDMREHGVKVGFHEGNQHARSMRVISSLLKNSLPRDILVISSELSREKLVDDLEHFVASDVTILDSTKRIIEQNLDAILLSTYEDFNSVEFKHLLLLDVCFSEVEVIKEFYQRATDTIDVLYEEDCKNVLAIRSQFEDY